MSINHISSTFSNSSYLTKSEEKEETDESYFSKSSSIKREESEVNPSKSLEMKREEERAIILLAEEVSNQVPELKKFLEHDDIFLLHKCKKARKLEVWFEHNSCDFGDIKKLDLSNCYLKVIPKALLNMNCLEILDLSNNQISNLPENMSFLINLQELNLSHNKLKSLPDSFADNGIFSSLSDLAVLDLQDNQLELLPQNFGNLKSLKILNLDRNHLCALPPSFEKCIDLNYLSLAENKLANIPWGEFKVLETLIINNNGLSSITSNIKKFKQLKYFYADNNQIQLISSGFGYLKELKVCNLSSNRLQKLPDNMGKLKNLEELYLSCNEIKEITSFIAGCTLLSRLDLDDNSLSQIPDEIGTLKNLRSLTLANNFVRILPDAIGGLESLEFLNIESNRLEFIPFSIGRLSHLKGLYLFNNALQELPSTIGDLHELQDFCVSKNKLKNLPEEIGFLKNVNLFSADYNELLALPETIWNMLNLFILSISHNWLQRIPEVQKDCGWTQQINIDFSHNGLASLPKSFELVPCGNLNLSNNWLDHIPKVYPYVTSLILSHNQISQVPSEMTFLGLKHLLLDHNLFPNIGFINREDLRTLEHLDMRGNLLSDLKNDRQQILKDNVLSSPLVHTLNLIKKMNQSIDEEMKFLKTQKKEKIQSEFIRKKVITSAALLLGIGYFSPTLASALFGATNLAFLCSKYFQNKKQRTLSEEEKELQSQKVEGAEKPRKVPFSAPYSITSPEAMKRYHQETLEGGICMGMFDVLLNAKDSSYFLQLPNGKDFLRQARVAQATYNLRRTLTLFGNDQIDVEELGRKVEKSSKQTAIKLTKLGSHVFEGMKYDYEWDKTSKSYKKTKYSKHLEDKKYKVIGTAALKQYKSEVIATMLEMDSKNFQTSEKKFGFYKKSIFKRVSASELKDGLLNEALKKAYRKYGLKLNSPGDIRAHVNYLSFNPLRSFDQHDFDEQAGMPKLQSHFSIESFLQKFSVSMINFYLSDLALFSLDQYIPVPIQSYPLKLN